MKKIYPHSVLAIFGDIFSLGCSIFSILVFIAGIKENGFYGCIGCVSGIILFYWSLTFFLSMIKSRLIIDDKQIIAPADIVGKFSILRRIQHKTTVNFDEVERIYICADTFDSHGKSVEGVFVAMPYLVFVCKDGQERMINVYYFTKKQVIYIINEIIRRAALLGNYFQSDNGEEMLAKFYSKSKNKDKSLNG